MLAPVRPRSSTTLSLNMHITVARQLTSSSSLPIQTGRGKFISFRAWS